MKTTLTGLMAGACLMALQGCSETQIAQLRSRNTIYSTDMVGKAASCATPAVVLKDGADNAVAMITGGGGWCGVAVRNGDNPYAAGLLVRPAKFGRVYVHSVGDDTRIDYTPAHVPVVTDSFAVKLIPGDATVTVTVNPTAGTSK